MVKKSAPYSRSELLQRLMEHNVDVRPIVSGNFLRNEVMRYLDHRIAVPCDHADWIHHHGFFIGNHHFDMTSKLSAIRELLD